jgi:tRNA pseudouridine13 synthase
MNVPERERICGILRYATQTPRCPSQIKKETGDFIVNEIIEGRLLKNKENSGLPLVVVRKENVDTISLERILSTKWKTKVRFLGLKDKRSISTQFAIVFGKGKNLQGGKVVGYIGREFIGSLLLGNYFRVRMRDTCECFQKIVEEVLGASKRLEIPNFFGIQRFGVRGIPNHLVGKLIVKRRFKEAAELIAKGNGFYEKNVKEETESGSDYIKAIRRIPLRIRKILVESYQSYIFNMTLSKALENGINLDDTKREFWCRTDSLGLRVLSVHSPSEKADKGGRLLVKIVGYAYRNTGSRFDELVKEILEDEEVEIKDFFIKEMQELSCQGGLRRASLEVIKPRVKEDGRDYVISFVLPKGQYATILLREIIKPTEEQLENFA